MASGRYCRPPELNGCIVAKLVAALFPFKEIDGRVVKQLPSYEYRNYYLAGTTTAGGESMEEFVLKISNSLMDIEVVEGLNAVLLEVSTISMMCLAMQYLGSTNTHPY